MKWPLAAIISITPVMLWSAPINWDTSIQHFNTIFINHPACIAREMTWTQTDCSNFRARALKRFQTEWAKNSYWDGYKVIDNEKSDKIVNSELAD